MHIPDFIDMNCPNCAVTIRLHAKKHVWKRVWNCEMCKHSFEIALPNWLFERGFFLEKGADQNKLDYFASADDPAELAKMQLRMAQHAIKKERRNKKNK